MSIVKVNEEWAYQAKNGQKYSLRKIAVVGISAVTLAAALVASGTKITKEIKYNIEMEQIQDLRTAAEEIEDMGVNAYIETKQGNYFIPDEIREYADVKEDLAEAKRNSDKDNIEQLQEKLNQQSIDIDNIGREIIKEEIKPTFDNPNRSEIKLEVKATENGPIPTAKQFDEYGNVEQIQQLDGEFVSALLQNSDHQQQIIEMMPDAIDNGEGIKVK